MYMNLVFLNILMSGRTIAQIGPDARLVYLNISITDVNDNAPHVSDEQLVVRFSESDPVGAVRTIERAATDADAGRNAELVWRKLREHVEYERERPSGAGAGGDSPYIGLNESSGGALRFVLLRPLDRELVRAVRVELDVSDRGDPAQSTHATANVEVRDTNDCRPTFLNSAGVNGNAPAPHVLAFNVSELYPIHQVFARVEATDCDVDERNRVLRYSIKEASSRVVVGEATGELSLREPLDFESANELHFTVIASDSGEPALTATASVLLRVINENDAPPHIASTLCRDNIVVKENGPAGQTLPCVYHVSDEDVGPFGAVRCELRGSVGAQALTPVTEYFELIQITEQPVQTYRIRTKTPLDREAVAPLGAGPVAIGSDGAVGSPIELTLACRDTPNASYDFLESRLPVRVLVEDENDCTPALVEPLSFRLPENEPIGSFIGELRAHDCDAGSHNSSVHYIYNISRLLNYFK